MFTPLRRLATTAGVRALRQPLIARTMATHFTADHEYIKVEGGVGTIGITDFAQAALGDVVYVDLPSVGDALDKGDSFGAVESVKAASDVYMPAGGEVLEANEALESEPSLVNEGAMTDGWFIKIKVADEAELGELMDEAAYEAHCEAEDH